MEIVPPPEVAPSSPPQIDMFQILSPAAREMFEKEIVPYLLQKTPGAEASEPTVILLWLMEEVQRLRQHVAELKLRLTGGSVLRPHR